MARPDREVRHEPGCCGRCGAGLAGRPGDRGGAPAVFDLPRYGRGDRAQRIERELGAGPAQGPAAGLKAPVQYGPRTAAVIVYLHAGRFLSKDRTALALAELFGIPCSSGTVAALPPARPGGWTGSWTQVRQGIAASEVVGFDETGLRVARLAWVHCARTGKYTRAHSRGQEAINAMGILPRFAGVAA